MKTWRSNPDECSYWEGRQDEQLIQAERAYWFERGYRIDPKTGELVEINP